MRSLFLIRYKMRGGSTSMQPFYAASLQTALSMFDRFMGNQGCERERYSVVGHREISERHVMIRQHQQFIDRLSPDEQLQFYRDREARKLASGEPLGQTTERNLKRLLHSH